MKNYFVSATWVLSLVLPLVYSSNMHITPYSSNVSGTSATDSILAATHGSFIEMQVDKHSIDRDLVSLNQDLIPTKNLSEQDCRRAFACGGSALVCYHQVTDPGSPYLGTEVVIKVLPVYGTNRDLFRSILNEVWCTEFLSRYPYFPRYFGTLVDGYFVRLHMEYIPGYTLREIYERSDLAGLKSRFSMRIILHTLVSILRALRRLHNIPVSHEELESVGLPRQDSKISIGLVHGDLNASNIIITENGEPKIIDFGHMRCSGTPAPSSKFDNDYWDPYWRLKGALVSPKNDIYSFFRAFVFLCTGEYKAPINFLRSHSGGHILYDAACHAFHAKPEDRMSAESLLHLFMPLYDIFEKETASQFSKPVHRKLSFYDQDKVNNWFSAHHPPFGALISELKEKMRHFKESVNRIDSQRHQ